MTNSAIVLAPIVQMKKKIDLLSGPTDKLNTLLTTAWTSTTLTTWLANAQNRNDWDQLWSMPNAAAALSANSVLMTAFFAATENSNTIYSSSTAWASILGSKVARDAWYGRVIPTVTPWVRPADWLVLPVLTDNDKKFVGLYGVTNDDSNFIALSATADYTVDWGDGVVENYASGVQANHKYTYANIGNETLSTRGYKQVIVTVTPQAGQLFTNINIQRKHTQVGLQTYSTMWLDIAIAGSNLTTLSLSSSSPTVQNNCVEQIKLYANSVTNFNTFLHSYRKLQSVVFDTSFATSMTSMFNSCYSLQSISLFNTSAVTNMSNMFSSCYSLQSIPLFNTSAVTNMNSMFASCYSLQSIPLLNTSAVTNMSNMFASCYSLESIPLFNTQAVTDMSYMFQSNHSLQAVPLFNTVAVTSMNSMFASCLALQTVPLLNTQSVTTTSNMFSSCYSLQSTPPFNTQITTNMSSMFMGCYSLKTVGLLNTGSASDVSYMFNNCYSLQTVPLFNTQAVLDASAMFNNCYSLIAVPLFNLQAILNTTSMFSGCSSLRSVPLFNTATALNMSNMFAYCYSLQTVPLFNTQATTNVSTMFSNCSSLQSVPSLNCALVTSASSIFAACSSLASAILVGLRFSASFGSCKLSKIELQAIFTSLGKASGSQTITVTNNWGNDAPISRSGTLTNGSNVVAMSDTSSLAVGVLVTGTGISSGVAVTFQDAGDTFSRTAHGLANGTPVSLSVIGSTTGISTYTTYYVVNATADTGQLSLTLGGAPISLTTNGTGTLLYGNFITGITPNVSVTLSAPASAAGAQTLAFRLLDISIATLKGWTVSS